MEPAEPLKDVIIKFLSMATRFPFWLFIYLSSMFSILNIYLRLESCKYAAPFQVFHIYHYKKLVIQPHFFSPVVLKMSL